MCSVQESDFPALQDQRGRKNPSKQLWEDSPRVSDTLPDLDSLIKQATADRLKVGPHSRLSAECNIHCTCGQPVRRAFALY